MFADAGPGAARAHAATCGFRRGLTGPASAAPALPSSTCRLGLQITGPSRPSGIDASSVPAPRRTLEPFSNVVRRAPVSAAHMRAEHAARVLVTAGRDTDAAPLAERDRAAAAASDGRGEGSDPDPTASVAVGFSRLDEGEMGMSLRERLRADSDNDSGRTQDRNQEGFGAQGSSSSSSWSDVVDFANEASKWLATAGAAAAVLVYHNREAALFAIGSVANAMLAKLLKKVIRQDRPATAAGRKSDHGMPSSHAQSLMFLGTYASRALWEATSSQSQSLVVGAGLMLASVMLTWLRVVGGLHTIPQVVVGGTVGTLSAILWFDACQAFLRSSFALEPSNLFWIDGFLLVGFLGAMSTFLWAAVRKWTK